MINYIASMLSIDKLKSILIESGLTSNEVKFYLTSFALGESTLGALAKTAKMDRSSCYLAFESLKQKGLILEDFKKYSKKVLVKPPQQILLQLQNKQRKLKRQAIDLEELMPELMAQYNKKAIKPTIRFYQGKSGFQQIQEDILSSGDDILLFTNQTAEKKFFDAQAHQKFIKRRIKNKQKIKVLAIKDKYSSQLQKSDKKELRQIKFLSQQTNFTAETYIYGHKVAMFAHKKEFIGFIIESEEFAQAQRAIFEEIWKNKK